MKKIFGVLKKILIVFLIIIILIPTFVFSILFIESKKEYYKFDDEQILAITTLLNEKRKLIYYSSEKKNNQTYKKYEYKREESPELDVKKYINYLILKEGFEVEETEESKPGVLRAILYKQSSNDEKKSVIVGIECYKDKGYEITVATIKN